MDSKNVFAQLSPDKSITIHTTKAVWDSAGLLAAAVLIVNLLLLKGNDGNVPLITFLRATMLSNSSPTVVVVQDTHGVC